MTTDFSKLLSNAKDKQQEREKREKSIGGQIILAKAHPLPKEQVILPGEKPAVSNTHDKQVINFVQGKSDKLPTFKTQQSPPPTKRKSIAELVKEKKAAKQEPIIRKDNVLYGTGATKKLADKQQAHIQRATAIHDSTTDLTTEPSFDQITEQHALSTKPIKEIIDEKENKLPVLPIVARGGEFGELVEIEYDPSQQAAIEGCLVHQFVCITGPAGSGKTTTEKEIINRIEHTLRKVDLHQGRKHEGVYLNPKEGLAIAFCAFTGRAAQQTRLVLDIKWHGQVSTIHAMLGYAPTIEAYQDKKDGQWKERKIFRPTFTKINKLPYDLILIDEAGMTPINLWNEIEDARLPHCRIIAIGDINQLPPVQGRSFFGFAMLNWPTYELTKIHRQAADNPIIANAHRVLRGELPIHDPKRFIIMDLPPDSLQACQQVLGVTAGLAKRNLYDPIGDGLIVPQNTGDLGQINLNQYFLDIFNKEKQVDSVIVNKRYRILAGTRHHYYAVDDKVMLLQNDNMRGLSNGMIGVVTNVRRNPGFLSYRSDLAHSTVHGSKVAAADLFTNGIDVENMLDEMRKENAAEVLGGKKDRPDEETAQRPSSHIVTVSFQVAKNFYSEDYFEKYSKILAEMDERCVSSLEMLDEKSDQLIAYHRKDIEQKLAFLKENKEKTHREISFSTAGQFAQLTHAYAFTCHKSQGGEYPTVIIVLHMSNIKLLYREWLYTAITRAKEKVVLLQQPRALRQALKVQRIKGATIQEKAQAFIDLSGKDNTIVPILPEAREL